MAETFEGLYVKFGANTVEFDRSVKGINNALSSLKKDFNKISDIFGKRKKKVKKDKQKHCKIGRKMENL